MCGIIGCLELWFIWLLTRVCISQSTILIYGKASFYKYPGESIWCGLREKYSIIYGNHTVTWIENFDDSSWTIVVGNLLFIRETFDMPDLLHKIVHKRECYVTTSSYSFTSKISFVIVGNPIIYLTEGINNRKFTVSVNYKIDQSSHETYTTIEQYDGPQTIIRKPIYSRNLILPKETPTGKYKIKVSYGIKSSSNNGILNFFGYFKIFTIKIMSCIQLQDANLKWNQSNSIIAGSKMGCYSPECPKHRLQLKLIGKQLLNSNPEENYIKISETIPGGPYQAECRSQNFPNIYIHQTINVLTAPSEPKVHKGSIVWKCISYAFPNPVMSWRPKTFEDYGLPSEGNKLFVSTHSHDTGARYICTATNEIKTVEKEFLVGEVLKEDINEWTHEKISKIRLYVISILISLLPCFALFNIIRLKLLPQVVNKE